MKILFTTPCYYPDLSHISLLTGSAQRHGIHLQPYGLGQSYAPHGVVSHIEHLAQAIRASDTSYSHVLMTDAYDSFFLAGEEEIAEKFLAMGSPVVISAEKNCWPLTQLAPLFPETRSPFRFPNAGGLMGERLPLLIALDRLMKDFNDPDLDGQACNPQGRWGYGLAKGLVEAKIDSDCEIFQTMSNVDLAHDLDVDVLHSRVYNTATNRWPCVIHFNGRCSNDEPMKEMYVRLFG